MTEPAADDPGNPERAKAIKRADEALASSVPDDNNILKLMLEMLFSQKGLVSILSVPGGIAIMLVYVVSKWGVAAILALQTLILQLHEDNMSLASADRSVQVAQVKATEEVISALSGVTEAVKGLSGEVASVRSDVNQLKQDRAADNRRIAAIAAQQQRLQQQRLQQQRSQQQTDRPR